MAVRKHTAVQVVDFIKEHPVSAAWIIQELLENNCNSDCERCDLADVCCEPSGLEKLDKKLT